MSTNTDGTATVDETIRLRDVIIDAVNRRNDGYNHALSILCYQLQTILNLQTDKRCLKFVKAIDKLIEDMRVNPRKE